MSAVGLGRPLGISSEDVDVAMICESDYIEDDISVAEVENTSTNIFVQFFISHTKLCEIMGVVLVAMYSPARTRTGATTNLTHSDMELANWMFNLPPEMRYTHDGRDPMRDYWSAILHIEYYTVLCLLHRPYTWKNMTPSTAGQSMYQSRNIGLTASNMSVQIFQHLIQDQTITKCPSFLVYSVFSAIFQQIVQLGSPDAKSRDEASAKLMICANALVGLNRVWASARSILNVLQLLRANPRFQRRIQEAAESAEEIARAAWADSIKESGILSDDPDEAGESSHRSMFVFGGRKMRDDFERPGRRDRQGDLPMTNTRVKEASPRETPNIPPDYNNELHKYATNLFPENTEIAYPTDVLSNTPVNGRRNPTLLPTPKVGLSPEPDTDIPNNYPTGDYGSNLSSVAAPSPFGNEAAAIFEDPWLLDGATENNYDDDSPNGSINGMPATINPSDWYASPFIQTNPKVSLFWNQFPESYTRLAQVTQTLETLKSLHNSQVIKKGVVSRRDELAHPPF
jgi:hypothetical protein